MKRTMRLILLGMMSICLAFCFALEILAQESDVKKESETALNITGETKISGTGFGDFSFLTDSNKNAYYSSEENASITLEREGGIAGVYLLFDRAFGSYTLTNNNTGESATFGENGFLHEFCNLDALWEQIPSSVTLHFSGGSVRLSEIFTFSQGKTPDFVQDWNAPYENGADLVLFSTHGDDEQLYFAGLLPLYAGQFGYRVQVVYMTDHRSGPGANNIRMHEMLDGLWAVGVKAYPVFGSFADFRIDSLKGTYDQYQNLYGVSEYDLQCFVVSQIRRFRPLVVVGHDLNGEYGHGMHLVYADLLTKAISLSGDESFDPESASRFGTWEIGKLYLHLYEENPVTMDYDTPLEFFGGMTAFEVSQKFGFAAHKSQHWAFASWLYGYGNQITKASQIALYNPCQFGLYYSRMGEDVAKNDLFENVISYDEQERMEQERLEQERLEQERLEQERLEQERVEKERLEQQKREQERLEQERLKKERRNQILLALSVVVLASLVLFFVFILHRQFQKTRPCKKTDPSDSQEKTDLK